MITKMDSSHKKITVQTCIFSLRGQNTEIFYKMSFYVWLKKVSHTGLEGV